ncbi:MAG: hypothetical protein WCV73_03385 [Patescibacteria group bacterium]
MDKIIILLLLGMLAMFVLMQNGANVWFYIFTLIIILSVVGFTES